MERPQKPKSLFDRRQPEPELEPEYDFKSSLLNPDEQIALNRLRKKLINGPGLTSDERAEYRLLSDKEKRAKNPDKLTTEEEQEFMQLSKEQISGENWSPEKAKRIKELYARKTK
jgi:hypothetical protein